MITEIAAGEGKIRVLVAVVNSPEFLAQQSQLLKLLSCDELELIVLNDSIEQPDQSNFFDGTTYAGLEEVCQDYGIVSHRVPQEIHENRHLLYARPHDRRHNATTRTADALDWGLQNFGLGYDGIVAVLDADMFPIKPFSFSQSLAGVHLCGLPQTRSKRVFGFIDRSVTYMWNGIFYFDARTLPNKKAFILDAGRIHGVPTDTGGAMHDYFAQTPELRFRPIAHKGSGTWVHSQADALPRPVSQFLSQDPRNCDGKHFAELYDGAFLHYRAHGNWDAFGKSELRKSLLMKALSHVGARPRLAAG